MRKRPATAPQSVDSLSSEQRNAGTFGPAFTSDASPHVIIDTEEKHPTKGIQTVLKKRIRQNEDLRQRDLRYAILVAGAAKMPMHMVWVPANRETAPTEKDHAVFKNTSWTNFIRAYFTGAIEDNDDTENIKVKDVTENMLNVLEELNLEWVRFQPMGLHEQVQASELNLVVQLCQAQIIPGVTKDFNVIIRKLRRMDLFYEVFALAVGGYVCAHAPYMLGAATTRYERDLQFQYKKENTNMLILLLKQNMHVLFQNDELGIDYCADVADLITVRARVDEDGAGPFPEKVVTWKLPRKENESKVNESKETVERPTGEHASVERVAEKLKEHVTEVLKKEYVQQMATAVTHVDALQHDLKTKAETLLNETRNQMTASTEKFTAEIRDQIRLQNEQWKNPQAHMQQEISNINDKINQMSASPVRDSVGQHQTNTHEFALFQTQYNSKIQSLEASLAQLLQTQHEQAQTHAAEMTKTKAAFDQFINNYTDHVKQFETSIGQTILESVHARLEEMNTKFTSSMEALADIGVRAENHEVATKTLLVQYQQLQAQIDALQKSHLANAANTQTPLRLSQDYIDSVISAITAQVSANILQQLNPATSVSSNQGNFYVPTAASGTGRVFDHLKKEDSMHP